VIDCTAGFGPSVHRNPGFNPNGGIVATSQMVQRRTTRVLPPREATMAKGQEKPQKINKPKLSTKEKQKIKKEKQASKGSKHIA
jgi:hypothetical protein